MIQLRDAIIRAWDNTQACPDGVTAGAKFCPSCLYDSLVKLLDEQAAIEAALQFQQTENKKPVIKFRR